MAHFDSIRVKLTNDSLWKQFHSRTTEMVVTKNGRKLFPTLQYTIEGMDPNQYYALFLHIERTDTHRYKYVSGEWIKCGKADNTESIKKVGHQDGVLLGLEWMRSTVCFKNVKITNNSSDSTSPSTICLTSMCKYHPVLSIYKMQSPIHSAIDSEAKQFVLPMTEFIAVTAYQNGSVTKLKVDNNPFAKGFRTGGTVDRKRSSSSPLSSDSSPKRTPSSDPIIPSSSHILTPTSTVIPYTVTPPTSTPSIIFPDIKCAPFQLPYPLPLPLYSSLFTPSSLNTFNPFLFNLSLSSPYSLHSSSSSKYSS